MSKRNCNCWCALLLSALGLNFTGWAANAAADGSGAKTVPPLLQQALAGPMKGVNEIIFCTRLRYDDPHWYANIGYYCDDEHHKAYAGNGKPDVGKLYKLNIQTGTTQVLLDAQGGSIRDPQVHYDGQKVLFSHRPAKTEFYHLYEIQTDGSGLRQLTSGEFDDYEPTYLPDGGIAFVSTRCQRWVNCWLTQVGVIYRCDGDGRNIQLLSANTEHDNTPWVLPDGRILYTRWEYVDRSQVEFHHLWTMNPDGTCQDVYYGNMHPNIVMIDAKPIPGTDKIVASFSPGHGVNEHAGIATIVTPQKGPDDKSSARPLHKGKFTRDPFPLSEEFFIVARENQVALLTPSSEVVLYTHTGEGQVHEPRPIMRRARERLVARHAELRGATGRMVLADIYDSRNLPGVRRGEIKKLLVLESLPKPVNFSGGQDLISWLGTFTLERVLGTVPVEPDGSACFEAPADRQLFFEALDENDLSVKRMQSFTAIRPGESLGCAGCHQEHAKSPAHKNESRLQALCRAPSKIEPIAGFPDVLDFNRDIQPILDKHCVRCHTYEKREGQAIFAGDLGPNWSHSFFSMFAHRLVADGRNGLGNQPPRSIGSSASRLLKLVDGSHYKAKVTPREWRTLWLWIESGAPYAGTYAALRNEAGQQLAYNSVSNFFKLSADVLQRRCHSCHGISKPDSDDDMSLPFNNDLRRTQRRKLDRPTAIYERIVFEHDPMARFSPNILLNLTRPRLSPMLLGPLAKAAGGFGSCGEVFKDTNDPDYQVLLSRIEQAKAQVDAQPRFGTLAFKPNPQYVRELKKFGILPAGFDLAKEPLDVFAADQKYWQSFWRVP